MSLRVGWLATLVCIGLSGCVSDDTAPRTETDALLQMADPSDLPLAGDGVDDGPAAAGDEAPPPAPPPAGPPPEGLAAVLAALGVGDEGGPMADTETAGGADPAPEAEVAPLDAPTPVAPAPAPPAPPQPPTTVEEGLDRAREGRGLPPLTRNRLLDVMAARHLRDMTLSGFYGHTGSDGSVLPDRANAVGFCFRRLVENLARGEERPERVLRQWMQGNPQERDNILMPRADSFGLAGSEGTWVLVIAEGC